MIAGIGQPSQELTGLPRFISAALYDSLLHIDPNDGSLKPGIANSWQVSDDARTFTFHLRDNVKWHDGEPLTGEDVVFTINKLSSPDVRLAIPAADFGAIEQVTSTDPHTVTVRLAEAYCPALTGIGTLNILPRHILEANPDTPTAEAESGVKQSPTPSQDEGNAGTGALPVNQFIGSGPLVLKDWKSDAITFVPNAAYWNGAPTITSWTFKIFSGVAEAQAALQAKQVDLINLDAAQASITPAPAGAKTLTRPANQFYSLAINNEQGIFADPSLRAALAMALDRTGLTKSLPESGALTLETSLLPSFWATPANALEPGYDQPRARQLLAAAGWTDSDGDGVLDKGGKPLSVSLWAIAGDPIDEPLAFAVRSMIAQVGFQVLLQLDDRDELLTRLFLHEFDLSVVPWNIPLDPDQHWYWQSSESKPGDGLNFVSYSNPQVDDLWKKGNQTPGCDPNARRAIYANAFRTISSDLPQVFLFAPPVTLEAQPRVLGLAPSPYAGDYWNLNSWQVGP